MKPKKAEEVEMVEVVATKVGYFGKLREVGAKFEVPADAKASWFKPVSAAAPAEAGPAVEASQPV